MGFGSSQASLLIFVGTGELRGLAGIFLVLMPCSNRKNELDSLLDIPVIFYLFSEYLALVRKSQIILSEKIMAKERMKKRGYFLFIRWFIGLNMERNLNRGAEFVIFEGFQDIPVRSGSADTFQCFGVA